MEILGKLHNLARAIADEENEKKSLKSEGSYNDMKAVLNHDKDGVLGLGLVVSKQSLPGLAPGEAGINSTGSETKETGKRLFGPLNVKSSTYLSQFILHIAAIGDIVDGADTTHDFNYFSLVYEWPKDVGYIFSCTIFILDSNHSYSTVIKTCAILAPPLNKNYVRSLVARIQKLKLMNNLIMCVIFASFFFGTFYLCRLHSLPGQ